jgi:hypothetical protein
MSDEQPEARAFLQWKGTDACLDFRCPCGARGHFDGDFAYYLRCPICERTWELQYNLRARLIEDSSHVSVHDVDVEEGAVFREVDLGEFTPWESRS